MSDDDADDAVVTKLTVEGMTCNACRKKVQEALKLVEGVESAVVELDTKLATVVSTADADDLIAAVEKAGKTATLADAASATAGGAKLSLLSRLAPWNLTPRLYLLVHVLGCLVLLYAVAWQAGMLAYDVRYLKKAPAWIKDAHHCKLLSDDFKKSLTPVYKLNLLGCGKRGYTIKDLCKAVPWLALEPGDMADPAADFVAAWLIEPVKGLLLG